MVRNGAGTETRPLASILLMNVETKRSIPVARASPLRRLRHVSLAASLIGPARAPRVAIASKAARRRELGPYGMTWVFMGVNGRKAESGGRSTAPVDRGGGTEREQPPAPTDRSCH